MEERIERIRVARRQSQHSFPARTAGAIALALFAGAAAPTFAVAQADYSSPAVVPPADAYVGDAVNGGERELHRWRTGTDTKRTLWVHFSEPPDGRPTFWDESVRALETWNAVRGIPLAFRRTEHPEAADVKFRWIHRFDANQAGTTDWETDGEGWITSAVVTLATEHAEGTAMSEEFLRLVALHELGHVVGLPHSEDPSDVLHPGNRNQKLSDRDVRSARQLYERLDPDRVRGP
jgi:hypothetical protein